jgi:ribosomal protein L44E
MRPLADVMTDTDLPTARTTLGARYVDLLLHCRSCHRSHTLQVPVDRSKRDGPLIHLRFRCTYCGHQNIGAPVTPQ